MDPLGVENVQRYMFQSTVPEISFFSDSVYKLFSLPDVAESTIHAKLLFSAGKQYIDPLAFKMQCNPHKILCLQYTCITIGPPQIKC